MAAWIVAGAGSTLIRCKLTSGRAPHARMTSKLRVSVDCRIADPRQGVGTDVLALAKALSESVVEDQKYTFTVLENLKDLLEPYIFGPCKLELIPEPVWSKRGSCLSTVDSTGSGRRSVISGSLSTLSWNLAGVSFLVCR
jgi:hypothetical protein